MAEGVRNIWGTVPSVTEMQSEGGAAGAIHGALQTGALACTFTASQGLLLMIPNMFKIAGELTPTVFHVSARTLATHALSIFGDHSDINSARSTGWAMLASGSVQETMDNALIAHAATLESRIPFLHFFDGFRTSHEVTKIEQLTEDDLRAMIDDRLVIAHRNRAMNPERPVLRGSAQNPDVFFQAREAINPYYLACGDIVQRTMDRFGAITGRQYHLFDYVGHPEAERVIVMMGSGAEAVHETVDFLRSQGEKVGLIKVRLYRPFEGAKLMAALPKTTSTVAVLDRTKEPGSAGEPLYQDVVTALMEHVGGGGNHFAKMPRVIGGRYGLSSKEFTPAMVKAIFDEAAKDKPKNHFSVGINDDVTRLSLDCDRNFSTEADDVVRALFYGLGSDGTVGANKNSVKIIGEETDQYAQGYFVYDSKKAGSVTVSHLRFGPRPIRSTYLVQSANFIACHQPTFLDRLEMLDKAVPGGTFLLNTPAPADKVWDTLPLEVQQQIVQKRLRFFVIDAYKVAGETGMGRRINTVMQTCFFAISGVLSRDEAIAKIKASIKKSYSAKGEAVVKKNCDAVDQTLANLFEVRVAAKATGQPRPRTVAAEAPDFVQNVTARMIAGDGDELPVSAFPVDGTFDTATAQWEKRNIALEIPVWDPDTCIQCNKCALVCPHAAIRPNAYAPELLDKAPPTFKYTAARGKELSGLRYTIQVAPEDCTGCGLCVEICPAKNKKETRLKAINMAPQTPLREPESENYRFFMSLPELDRRALKASSVKGSQFMLPLFEYSGACAGCGETPYVKLVSQLFGDRAVIGNATGCSSIYGGNLPTTPWSKNKEGRGPTWSNSLFEDNAEFGLGFRLSLDKQHEFARELLKKLSASLGSELVEQLLTADQSDETGIMAQRERVVRLKTQLAKLNDTDSRNLLAVADSLVKRSVWIIGGDGWAYDIGYGGLDHVLASGRNVNILVLDTEVYSNTGGQMSKSTPCGAVAKFATAGKATNKKDLGQMAMAYGNVYVASVAMGANDNHTVQAFAEAESYDGPSLIIAYSHCIAHGINMRLGMNQQKMAVDCGHWMLYRYDPRRAASGLNPLQLDSREPKIPVKDYIAGEDRYQMLIKSDPQRATQLIRFAQEAARHRYEDYARRAQANDEQNVNSTASEGNSGPVAPRETAKVG
jgi:pyruvate-ferredoxin/flavodoxin oxidoreductase